MLRTVNQNQKVKYLCLVALVVFLGGCATAYQRKSFFSGGGFSEIATGTDSFVVTFKGNSFTDKDRVAKLSLLRASEITLQNGYRFFVVLNQEDLSSNSHTRHSVLGGVIFSRPYTEPGTSIRIKCFKEDPSLIDGIDARFYWDANNEETDF